MSAGKSSSQKTAAASVDEQLAKYRSMRHFGSTAEPRGREAAADATSKPEALPFVIQKHAATRLHYDFRLGWRGVLKSWAVAKGPSYVVKDKRLAVQVEDHPIEYGGFEGTIPKGQYGGGTVMLWDHGTWEPVGDADEGLRTGRLKFILHGEKLHGHWTLIRMGGRAAEEKKPNWLLIKEHDEYERDEEAPQITEEAPNSVLTKRDLNAIARDEDHVWNSNRGMASDERAKMANKTQGPAGSRAPNTSANRRASPGTPVSLPAEAKEESFPGFIEPQLASQVAIPPPGEDWLHEVKLDGYRIQAHLKDGKASLLTRKALDWTHRMPTVAAALGALDLQSAVLDGEVVVLDAHGLSSFADLQASFQEGSTDRQVYYIFDLLHLNGRSLRGLPLLARKEMLSRLLTSLDPAGAIRFSDHMEGRSSELFAEVCRIGGEGTVSKESKSRYVPGRSASWVKAKCSRQQEFVIGGFTLPSNGGDGIGALLLGVYEDGRLIYTGRTGTGFTQTTQRLLRKQLEALKAKEMPFSRVEVAARRGALWVTPKLVAEVAFRTWTADNLVRQASFKGLREDKPANEVRRETSANPALIAGKARKEEAPSHAGEHPASGPSARKRAEPGAKRPIRKPVRTTQPAALPAALRLTHPDKLLDSESGLTKRTLAAYYATIADRILPHIADRPLSLVRCPDGTASKCFFQKHVKIGLPKGIGSVAIADKKGGPPEPYITLNTAEALIGLSQMNVLELHPWGSKSESFEQPDRLIFDLDPDESISWATLRESAEEVRERLRALKLKCFLKGTGGKGLHIVAPIQPEHDWAVLKEFAHSFVSSMERDNPQLYLTKMTKAARKGRIYLDYLRNERGATAVAPYSPRSRKGVPCSVPLAWSDLKEPEAPRFPAARFTDWVGRTHSDPWKDLLTLEQSLLPEAVALMAGAAKHPRSRR